jgi:hypothetical protein
MPKPIKVKENAEEKLYHKSWVRFVLALLFFGIGYGFISFAINDGNILLWAIGFFWVGWGVNNLIRIGNSLIKKL